MDKDKVKILKFICYAFGVLWILNVTRSFYDFYITELPIYDKGIFFIKMVGFVSGIVLSLVSSGGFMMVFWYSYRLKYNDEKVFGNIVKKIIAFLFATGVFKSTFGFSIFILSLFFTLVIFIKSLEKESRVTISSN